MNVLERERKRQNMGPGDLAIKADIDRTYYWRIETGRKRPSYEYAKKISFALDGKVSVAQIMELAPAPATRRRRHVEARDQSSPIHDSSNFGESELRA